MGLLGTIDKGLAWLLMLAILAGSVFAWLSSVGHALSGITAFDLVKVSNDACGMVVAVLVFCLWHIYTHYDENMRSALTYKTRGPLQYGMLPGGFLPIPAALSVGVLLFVTGTFVGEASVPGSLLSPGPFCVWLPGKTCRANAVENENYLTGWFSRFSRGAPTSNAGFAEKAEQFYNRLAGGVKIESKVDPGSCFFGSADAPIPITFDKNAIMNTDVTCDAADLQCADYKCNADGDFGPKAVNGTLKPKECISNLEYAEGSKKKRVCMYQCVAWLTFSLRTLLENSGSIAVGASIVLWLTNVASSKCGRSFVTAELEPEALMKLFANTGHSAFFSKLMKPIKRSYCVTAFPIVSTYVFLKFWLVTRIDSDGFYTVDYYVTFVLLFSALMAVLLRCSNPFKGEALLFTDKLWKDGVDLFVMHGEEAKALRADLGHDSAGNEIIGIPLKLKEVECLGTMSVMEIDLYQWLGLPGSVRRTVLINYARRPDKKNTQKGHALANLQDMTVNHQVEEGDRVIVKQVHIPKQSKMKLVKWIDDQQAMVNYNGDEVEVDARRCIEDNVEWKNAIEKADKEGLVSIRDLRNSVSVEARSAVTPLLHDIEASPY